MRFFSAAFVSVLFLQAATPPEQEALDRISAASLRGNLSFLASDALEGRATPSRGLTVAAEFIASCFRRAGLQPLTPNYLQMADLVSVKQRLDGFQLTLTTGGHELRLNPSATGIRSLQPVDLTNAAVIELPSPNVSGQILAGQVVAADAHGYPTGASLRTLRAAKPSLILLVSHSAGPGDTETSWKGDPVENAIPVIHIFNEDAARAVTDKRPLTITLHLAAPVREDARVANVIGLLPGSDVTAAAQYVLVSAHYDHLGVKDGRVYNGANDNGSGVVSAIEMANALGTLATRPKRGIIFAAFFGEEDGLLGSEYYARHPPVPLSATVANINLEQMGRTDEQDGREVGAFAFTGPSYSTLPAVMTAAAKAQGVKVYNKRGADSFFDRSDNYSFAEAGVVAHTVVVAFEYPDYHGPGDKWEKIDYANMAKVDRAVAAGILDIAKAPEAPRWIGSRRESPEGRQ